VDRAEEILAAVLRGFDYCLIRPIKFGNPRIEKNQMTRRGSSRVTLAQDRRRQLIKVEVSASVLDLSLDRRFTRQSNDWTIRTDCAALVVDQIPHNDRGRSAPDQQIIRINGEIHVWS